jgi:TPR repeat protein
MHALCRSLAVITLLSAPVYAATFDPKQDEKNAAEFRRRAGQGDSDAALQLGNLLARGRIPESSYGTAVSWYKKGCELRSISACHNAGISHENGRNGAARDFNEAAGYYLQAAERAFLPSMYNLAVMIAESRISTVDNREGLKWMLVAQKAAAQCPEMAICKNVTADPKGYRSRLEAPLSSREIRETYKMAEDWRPRK